MTTFKYNDRVRVSNTNLKTHGCLGTITNVYWDTVNVRLDNGQSCNYSMYNLKRVTKEEETKENTNMAITGDFKVAKIKFLGGSNTSSVYEYAMFDDYQVGSTVVVKSASHGFGVAKIIEVIDKDKASTKKFEREVVALIDMEPYEARKKNRARLQELNNRMEKRAQEINKLAIFEMMAEKDESLREMLAEYKELIG